MSQYGGRTGRAFHPSPGEAAKAWAGRYRDYQGKLVVVGLTPSGKGGWQIKRKDTVFVIIGGDAFVVKSGRSLDGRYTWNGQCQVCGRWCTKPMLSHVCLADPEAGRPIPQERLERLAMADLGVAVAMPTRVTWTWGALCFVHSACDQCIEAHAMTRLAGGQYIGGAKGHLGSSERFYERAHPTLCLFPDVRGSLGSRLVITAVQEGKTSLENQIEFQPPLPRADESGQAREMTGGADGGPK